MIESSGSAPSAEAIRTQSQPDCYLCGSTGRTAYKALGDRRFGALGEWTFARCPRRNCGLLWLNPMPLEADIGKAYRNYHTHDTSPHDASGARHWQAALVDRYVRQHYGYRSARSFWAGMAVSLAGWLHPGGAGELGRSVAYLRKPSNPSLLLDVGCGNGEFLAGMKRLGWRTEGVDPDPEAIRIAQARGIQAKVGTLTSAKYPQEYADAVVVSHVIEHVHDPVALLRECWRVLKPGGRLVVLTPNTASLLHRQYGGAWFALDPPRHLILFNPGTIRLAAERAEIYGAHVKSTVYGARGNRVASRQIRRTAVVATVPSTRSHLVSVPVQAFERCMVSLGWQIGEEILLTAFKDDTGRAMA